MKDLLQIKLGVLFWAMVIFGLVVGCASLKSITDKVCNPTTEEKATAQQMLVTIDQAQAIVGEFMPSVNIVKASVTLKEIVKGGCFVLAELNDAFKVVDAANNAVIGTKKPLLKGIEKPATLPEYPALRKYVAGK